MIDLELPPNARPAEISGYDREQFNNALIAALAELKKKYNYADTKTLHVSPPADARALAEFYDRALESEGYRRTASAPAVNTDSQTLVWEKNPGGDFVAVVIITTGSAAGGDAQQYLVICQ